MLLKSNIKFFLVKKQNCYYTIPVKSKNEYEAFCVIFFFFDDSGYRFKKLIRVDILFFNFSF